MMSEGAEVGEYVALDEENYTDEMDDDVEEHIDDYGVDGADVGIDENAEGNEEYQYEDSTAEASGKDQLHEADRNNIATESVEDEVNWSSMDEDEKEKHNELIALPPHGSEVFIGGLPQEACEDDLRELCEPMGDILGIRLMKDGDTGEGKGYASVAFKTKEVAQKAIEELHNKEFKGKTLRCSLSGTKRKLFIGNVPKTWTEDKFKKVIEGVGPGVENIELIKDHHNTRRKNRGFAFVLYYNNACADYSRQKMSSANFKLDGNIPTVTWADPKNLADNSASSQVKALYVKNIPENATTEQLKELFCRHGEVTTTEQLKELFCRHGEVTNVVMPPGRAGVKRKFGFIYYTKRSSALKALKDTEKYEIDGQVLEVVLAKPQTEKKSDGGNSYNPGLYPNHTPNPGYGGFSGNMYGNLGAGYGSAAAFQQPVIYGRGPMPEGMQLVSIVLPDGRIGYVLQQPGVQMPAPQPHRVDRSNAPSGHPERAGGSGNDEGNHSRRYRPY